jgi:hypothetical protein
MISAAVLSMGELYRIYRGLYTAIFTVRRQIVASVKGFCIVHRMAGAAGITEKRNV